MRATANIPSGLPVYKSVMCFFGKANKNHNPECNPRRKEEMSNYEYQKRNETQEIFIPVAERLGNEVIEFTNVSKAFGDKLLIDDLSFKVPAKEQAS